MRQFSGNEISILYSIVYNIDVNIVTYVLM